MKGTPNKLNFDIVQMAREYGPMCVAGLADLAMTAEMESTRALAMRELLDRGFGKPHQGMSIATSGNINVSLASYAGRQAVPVLSVPRGNGHSVNGGPNGHHDPTPE